MVTCTLCRVQECHAAMLCHHGNDVITSIMHEALHYVYVAFDRGPQKSVKTEMVR